VQHSCAGNGTSYELRSVFHSVDLIRSVLMAVVFGHARWGGGRLVWAVQLIVAPWEPSFGASVCKTLLDASEAVLGAALWSGKIGPLKAECFAHPLNRAGVEFVARTD
jgi:hypothetical protein